MEEAAAVAAEYIATLDNLPSEVQHLLTEIKHKEARSQELQTEIQRENAKYIRHSLRGGLTARDEALPARVAEIFAEVDRLAAEKLALAQRLVVLVQRARARLDYDLSKVLVLQGDLDPAQQGPFTARTAATQVNESLRGAMALPDALPVPAPPVVPPPLKRKRAAAQAAATAIKLPSPAPTNVPVVAQRSARLAVQAQHRPSPVRTSRRVVSSVGPDEDAEGEDDVEEVGDDGDETEDKSLYCFCQKMSYGEMIACDNAECAFQWFHLPCVNLKPPLPENWYCSDCIGKGFAGNAVGGGSERARKRKR